MAFSVNGVSQTVGVGAVKNNQPANPTYTAVGELQVYNGVLVPDIRLTNPGIKI